MRNSFFKAIDETFFPKNGVTYIDDADTKPWKYLLDLPSRRHSLYVHILYYLSFAYILEPLRNIVKVFTEFPITFVLFFLEELHDKTQNRLIKGLTYFHSKILFILREAVIIVTSPLKSLLGEHRKLKCWLHYSLLSTFSQIVVLLVPFPISVIILGIFYMRVFSGCFQAIESESFNRDVGNNNTQLNIALNQINFNFPLDARNTLEDPILKKAWEESDDFKYRNFNPNATVCAYSKKKLGFTQDEIDMAEKELETRINTRNANTEQEKKDLEDLKKRAVKTAVGVDQQGIYFLLNELPPKYQEKCEVVPSRFTVKFEPQTTICPITLEVITEAEHAYRSYYGTYFDKSMVEAALSARPGICPVTKRHLTLELLKPVDFSSSNSNILTPKLKKELDVCLKKPATNRLSRLSLWTTTLAQKENSVPSEPNQEPCQVFSPALNS